jgi:tRNA-specific 2-thiouridylase
LLQLLYMQPASKGKIFVGMSGGVDSSVTAALLKRDGWDVTGVFIKVWQPEFLPCGWKQERLDAKRVAAKLGIPFLMLDLSREYEREVANYMIEEYRAGRTPNPDVMCNRHIKFGSFLQFALSRGADKIATGHHVRSDTKNGIHRLLTGKDAKKDQTYFLWTLTQEQLSRVEFPIGHYTKPQVRSYAEKFELPTAHKKDSQGVCFLGKLDMKTFLEHYIPPTEGAVLDVAGKRIGTHDGTSYYTLGQRHGFTVAGTAPETKPHYIIGKDPVRNVLIVAAEPDRRLSAEPVRLTSVNWILGVPPEKMERLAARTRYRQPLTPCFVKSEGDGSARVTFACAVPRAVPGQSLVIYKGDVCVGGGIVA